MFFKLLFPRMYHPPVPPPVLPQPQEKIIDSGPKYNPRPGHRRVLSEGGGEVTTFLPPEVFQSLQIVESQDTRK